MRPIGEDNDRIRRHCDAIVESDLSLRTIEAYIARGRRQQSEEMGRLIGVVASTVAGFFSRLASGFGRSPAELGQKPAYRQTLAR